MSKKAVVTGGAGFIGSHIADALIERGYDVHVIDNLSGGKRERVPAAATLHELDVNDTDSIRPIVSGAEVVYHEAALPRVQYSIDDPWTTHQANIDGTLSLLIAARDGKAGKVVYAASSSAYGEQETLPLTEDMPAAPVHPYGLQKFVGEEYLRLFAALYGLPTVSLRYFNVYGPRLDPDGPYALVIGRFLKQRVAGEPLTITGDGEQTRDFTNVRDVVRANMLALESTKVGKGEVINIGAGRAVSINELATLIGGEKTYGPARVEAKHTLADITRAKDLLGWEPTIALEDGIAELKREFGLS